MKSIDELLSIKSIDGPLSTATEHEHACCRILFVIKCSDASAIRNLQKECWVKRVRVSRTPDDETGTGRYKADPTRFQCYIA